MRGSRSVLVGAAIAACGMLEALRCGTSDDSRSVTRARGALAHEAPRSLHHVLATGQSLSVGVGGTPPLTTVQPYDNVMLEPGVMSGGRDAKRFLPLVEGDVLAGGNVPVETMSSAFANLVTRLSGTHALLVSVHGVGGVCYAGLKRGTAAYESGLAQVRAAREIAGAAGVPYRVSAVTSVHGESDHVGGNDHYEADLREWQRDYERDVHALTGRAEPLPLLITQISSWTMYGGSTSAIPSAQLRAHEAAPGKVVLVGPKYHLPYAADGVHLTSEGYRHMGEDYAKAYRRVVVEGGAWEPVRPRLVTRRGAVITVAFHVPAPPLVLDTTRVLDPGDHGFAYVDDSAAPPAIAQIAVTGPDTVTITLRAAPTSAGGRLRYAITGVVGAPGGPTAGPRGNLRDSDATPSASGEALFNWCVHFDAAVP